MIIIKDLYRKIYQIIKRHDEIVIARHVSADPDALASQIALRDSIRETFSHKKVYAIGQGVHRFKYIGSLDKVDVKSLNKPLLVVLDVPNFARVDGIEELDYSEILKIDHHPRIDIIGNVDWTDDNNSSTCEMIINLIFNTKLVMNKSIAEKLFIGMVFDSERFLLKNTTANTFKTVSELIEKTGIDFVTLYDKLYEKGINEERFHSYLVNNINISENGFGYLYVTNDVLKEYNVEATSVSNQVNSFNFIKEIYCWMFVVYDERANIYKANIRSRGPVINEIAMQYGGGGHKFASGCRSDDYSVMENLAHDLDEACKDYGNNKDTEEEK